MTGDFLVQIICLTEFSYTRGKSMLTLIEPIYESKVFASNCRFTTKLLEDIHLLIHYVDLYLYQTVHWFHWAWSVIAVLELCQHTRSCSSSPYSGVMFELFQSSWLSSQYTSKFTHPIDHIEKHSNQCGGQLNYGHFIPI